jgi:hypothetical protein
MVLAVWVGTSLHTVHTIIATIIGGMIAKNIRWKSHCGSGLHGV